MDVTKNVDFSSWSRPHWTLFSSLALGFFMWGVIAATPPLIYPLVNAVWFLIVPILAQLAGDLGISALSDMRLGRKTTFFLTMGLYGSGAFLIFLATLVDTSFFLPMVVAGIVLADLGIEGEVPTSLSYTAENMPLKLRETMLILLPNFDNVGAAFAAAIAYLTYSLSDSYMVQLKVLGLTAVVLVGVALVLRRALPESVRWLVKEGKEKEAVKVAQEFHPLQGEERRVERRVSLLTRFLFLILISISQYLTYGLMAYTVADFYFKGSTVDLIALVANLGASSAGVVASLLANRLGSRKFAVFSFLGGTLTMIPVFLLTTSVLPFSMVSFYSLLTANMFFSEFGWAVRTVFEPTLMPIRARALFIGVVRVAPMLSYAASIQVTSSFSIIQFVGFNVALWSLGLVASLLWFGKGYDTNMVPIEETSGVDEASLN
ncbi:MFS transporter [Sulfuracidifex tepidarius]|uniref:Sialic acid transporter n=1 Tax=Sulfuracidifex tepidarius TaxID=1294262 RepID=A0A510E0D9_9CREN|nr:MFS transporter [Sulfuracidifex tepidarius]BBG25963.1 Putative sialic acid transporter [Sulfuracidifex tepidarius]